MVFGFEHEFYGLHVKWAIMLDKVIITRYICVSTKNYIMLALQMNSSGVITGISEKEKSLTFLVTITSASMDLAEQYCSASSKSPARILIAVSMSASQTGGDMKQFSYL